MVSKKKKENINDSFPNGNFLIDGFNTPQKLDRNLNGDLRICQKQAKPIEGFHIELMIQWRLIFADVIHCSRLRLWVGYFIYFEFTPVFFCLMFLMDVLYFN